MKARRYLLLICVCWYSLPVFSQGLCANTALAPVFKQDFGQGALSTTTSAAAAGSTNYTFGSVGTDGNYILTPRVENANKADWTKGGDHTGNTNGNMFLVNAGGSNSIFFQQTVTGLCPGSSFNFSAWIANMNTATTQGICGAGLVYPKVTFNIRNSSTNAILGTFTTGNLPLSPVNGPVNWQEYGFQFTLPSGTTSIKLEMVDFHGGGSACGNDLALDDIEFTACTPEATVTLSTSSSICAGTNTTISSSLINSPFTTPAYQWQKSTDGGATWNNVGTAGTSATSYSLNNVSLGDAAQYRVLVGPDVGSLTSNTCITASNTTTLTVNPLPQLTTGSNSPVCSGNSIHLSSTVTSGTATFTYNWTGPGAFSSSAANPVINSSAAANSGTYSLVVTDSKSCSASGNTTVTVNTTPAVAAITGNGGGCVNGTLTLGNATPGGTWGSSNTAIATVDANGVVSLVSAGTATITYTVTNAGCSASASKSITVNSVSMQPDVIECNNGIAHFSASDPSYGVTYSNSNMGNTYQWNITGGTFSYQGSSTANSQYPNVQLQTGSSYTVTVQFSSGGISCSATQVVHKNITASETINGPDNVTVCFNTVGIALSGTSSAVTNNHSWTTSGTGVFSNPSSLNTTYTPSAADKAAGVVTITLSGSSSLNMNGNCGSATATDFMTLNIQPENTGTNTTSTVCSNQLFTHTVASAIPGSSFTWFSSVLGGTGSGNATNGSGNIANTLTNNSTTTDFVVRYTITPTSNGCTGTPYTVTVTVKPLPSLGINNASLSICTGSSVNIQLSDVLTGTQYSWTSTVVSGTASGNSNRLSPASGNTISDVLTNTSFGAAVIRYHITSHSLSGCTSAGTTDVTVYPQPTTALAGNDQSLCNTSAATLNGNTPVSGTGNWTVVSGPNTPAFTNASSSSTTVTGLTTGSYVFRWSISNGICTASQDDVTVVVSPVTQAGTLSADATVCASANSGALTVTGYTGNIINWQSSTDNGVNWNTSANNTPNFVFNNLSATTLFKASVQSGSCSVLFSNTVTITVLQPPTVAIAGPDQQRNGINSATLAGNEPVNGTGTWTQVSGPNTAMFSNASNYNSSVTNLVVGAYTFRWTITNGICGNSIDDMQLVVDPPTVTGTLSADATVCATGGNGATLSLSGYLGDILRWQYSTDNGTNWVDITNITATHTYSNLTATTLFRAEVQNGTDAPAFTSHVTITVLQPVTVADAGLAQTLCDLSSATLAANNPVSGTGTWSVVSGPSATSFSNLNNYNAGVNGLVAGTYQLKWTIANGGVCPSSEDLVDITVVPPTNPGNVTADATVCATANSGSLSITGFTGDIVHGEYSVDNGVNWNVVANSNNTTVIPYLNLSSTTQFRALVKNSVCPAVYSNIVTVTVLQAVTAADAGTDQQLCAAGSATLAANNPSSGTGSWTQVSGPNTAGFVNAGAYNTSVTGLTTGTYVFRWTITNGACATSQDDVTVVIDPATVPGTISGTALVCYGNNSGTLSLTGNTGAIVRWEYSIDGGSSWTNISNNTNTYSYTNLTATTLFRASVQSGVCGEQFTNNVLVTINPLTVAGTISSGATVCASSNNGTLTLNGYTGSILQWESSTDNGNNWTVISHTNSSLAYTNLSATTIYRALVQNGICAAQYTTQVTITVNPVTVAGTLSAGATVCASANNGTLALSGYTGNIIQWESSTDNGNTWATISNTTNSFTYNNLTVTTVYRALVQSGVCASQHSNQVTILVNPATIAGTLSADATVCVSTNNGTLSLSGYNGSILQWESSTDNGATWTVITNTTNSFTYTNLSVTTLYRALVQSGICASQYSNHVTITVSPVTVSGTLSADATVCASSNNGTLSLSGYTGNLLRWEYSTDNGNTWTGIVNTTNSFSYNNLIVTTIYRARVQNGACALQYSNNTAITVNPVTVAGTLAGNATVCAGSNNGTLSLGGFTGNILQWENSVDNGATWSIIANTTGSFTYNNLTATTIYRVLVQSGICAPQYSNNVTVTVNAGTIAGTLSANATVCASSNHATLSLSGYTGDILRWESSTDNGNTWVMIANTTNTFTYSNLSVTTIYRVLVQSGVCASQYANPVTITVNPVTVTGTLSADAAVCASANNGTLFINGQTGNILQWEISTDNASTWAVIAGTANSFVYNNLIATSAYRALVQSGMCAPQYTNKAIITVVQPVTQANSGADQVLCSTNTITLQGNSPVSGMGEWSLVSGPSAVTITNPSSPATGVSGITNGTYQFKWRIFNNTCLASADTVSIQILPALVNTIDTVSKTICTGQPVTITGIQSAGGNGTYQYQWEQSTNGMLWLPVPGAGGSSYSFTPATNVFVRRIVTSHTCSITSGITAILVQPSLATNVITGNQDICLGENIIPVRGTLATGGDGNYRYQWELRSDSSSISGISNDWAKINNANSKDLPADLAIRRTTSFRRIVSTNFCNGPQSLASNTVTVKIKSVPQLSLQYKAGAYCTKDTTIEFITQTQNVDSIRWDFGDGNTAIAGAGKITHRYTQPGIFIPRALASNTGNCTVLLTPRDTIRIEDSRPGFKISAVFDCGKTTYRFIDTSQSYFAIDKRTWLVNNIPVNSEKEYRHAFSKTGDNEARLQLLSINGCESSLDAKFNVSVFQYPKADINAVAQACQNNLVQLKSMETAVDSVIIRSWNLGNGLLASDSIVKVSYFASGEYTVKLTVATVNKCYDSAFKVLSVYPTPKLSVSSPQVVCKGDSAVLRVSGAINYIWKDQDNNIICNNCPSIKTLPQKNTQYNVIGYSEYGCSEIGGTSVRVIPPLTLTAKQLDTLCAGESRKLIVSGADAYTWLPAAGLSSYTSANPSASPVVTTTYTVIGKDAFNCFADTASIKLVVGNPTAISVGKDTVVLSGNAVQLRAIGALPNIKKWRWEGGDFSCLNCPAPVVKVVNDVCVTCTVTNIYGCASSDTLCIKTFCPTTEVFIPNAFTPDGDGINDKVFVQGRGIKMIKSFRIFSRWGELLFEKTNFLPGDPSAGWDGKVRGKAASPDVFVYVCEVVCEKGTPNVYKGNVAIIK